MIKVVARRVSGSPLFFSLLLAAYISATSVVVLLAPTSAPATAESALERYFYAGIAFVHVAVVLFAYANLALLSVLSAIVTALLLALGINYLLTRRLAQRLTRLEMTARNVAAGDFACRAVVDSADEIGRLGRDLNALTARLEHYDLALRIERERAERLLESNRQFVVDVSHEFRTPLAILGGYLEVLEWKYHNKAPAQALAVAQGQVQHVLERIERLLTHVRPEEQLPPVMIEMVDARVLVQGIAHMLGRLARYDTQIEIVAALPDDLPLVYADRRRLEQVLVDLVRQALRRTRPGGIVALEGAVQNGLVTLAIADTSTGMSPEELALVFEHCYRGEHPRAREISGADSRLALVREMIMAMGGGVVIESITGRGSRFSVVLRRGMPAHLSAPA